ncbi:carbohydrate kinase family protein [Phytohalomonas tamaricis]|uniref:carbohydrate kinase family protein n=1 Tax=Phytohalomonas tamaricis TaxID=2081032 RepID=UPI000D0B55C4|nr:carbohydrate kinase [Phytohalomonas tamaricis]
MFLVCGEALFDFFADPKAADSDASSLGFDAVAGGSPFNVAIGLKRLGRESALFTGLSTDFLGQRLARVLAREGVSSDYLIRLDDPTTLAMVALDPNGSPQYAFYNDRGADRGLALEHLPELNDSVRGIHIGSYSLVVSPTAETIQALVERESERRLISLDPNIRLQIEPDLARWRERIETLAQVAHIIKVSEEDLEALYSDRASEEVAQGWLSERCKIVIMTRGEQGVIVFTQAHGRSHVAACQVEMVDAVGAGDTFQAALLCWLDEHDLASPAGVAELTAAQIEAMLTFASAAAALTCSRRGPDLPRRDELAEIN